MPSVPISALVRFPVMRMCTRFNRISSVPITAKFYSSRSCGCVPDSTICHQCLLTLKFDSRSCGSVLDSTICHQCLLTMKFDSHWRGCVLDSTVCHQCLLPLKFDSRSFRFVIDSTVCSQICHYLEACLLASSVISKDKSSHRKVKLK